MQEYSHKPDWPFIEHQYERSRGRINANLERIERVGVDTHGVATILTNCLRVLSYGWALGRPIDELRELVRPGVEVLHTGLDVGIEPDKFALGTMLTASVIVGDQVGARGVAGLAAAMPLDAPPNDRGDRLVKALAALVLDQPDEAAVQVATLADLAQDPSTPPEMAESLPRSVAMLRAVIERDGDAWLAATRDEAEARAREFGRSLEDRRHRHGLLSTYGTALARLAHRAGLPLSEQPVFGADLIRDL